MNNIRSIYCAIEFVHTNNLTNNANFIKGEWSSKLNQIKDILMESERKRTINR